MKRLAPAISLLLALCVSACAPQNAVVPASVVPPPKIPEDLFANVSPTVKKRLALHFALGEFSGSFEKTTLAAVQKAAGGGVIQHQGDAGESMYWLCYTLPSATPPQRIWIMSSGEMGGHGHEVTEIDAEVFLQSLLPNSGCPDLPENMLPISVDNGIAPDMDQQTLIDILGNPSKADKNFTIYLHLGKVSHSMDEESWLAVHFTDGKADSVRAGKITTN